MQGSSRSGFIVDPARYAVIALLLAILATAVVMVAGPVVADLSQAHAAWGGLGLDRSDLRAIGWSLGYSTMIGVLATVFGCSMSTVMARRGLAAGVMLLPVLLAPYLAYAGWGQLRAPGNLLGDWLLTQASRGEHWVPILAGRAFAVLGLSLWASPIAGMVMAAGIARRGRGFDDSLHLDRASWWQRLIERARFHLADVLGAVALVGLVMLGSAVPLHVAQVPTYSIELWLELAETDPTRWGLVWVRAWPPVLVAIIAAWVIARRVVRPAEPAAAGDHEPHASSRSGLVLAWTVWGLAVAVPCLIAATNLTGVSVFRTLWRLDREAMLTSLARGGFVGIVLVVLAGAVSVLLSSGERRDRSIIRWVVGVSLVLGLIPGFLVGASVSRFGIEGQAGPIAAQIARFCFVGVLGGVWACRGESREHRATRMLDSGGSIAGWWASVFPAQWKTLLGIGLVGLALSMHEIEATVLVEPPGSGSLAQKMLGHLHFARMDELNATALVVVALGFVPSLIAGCWLAGETLATDKNRDR